MDVPSGMFATVHELQKKQTEAFGDGDGNPDEIRDRINTKMGNHGYSRISSGDYRVVYGNGNHVVKVAWRDLGVDENKQEIANWDDATNTMVDAVGEEGNCCATRYLAEIFECDRRKCEWIVMEQVSTDGVSSDKIDKLRTSFNNAGLNIDDFSPLNIGRRGDTPVVFDYGGK